MPQQLIYTSAPRGVVAGRSGYCTVARSASMREALMLRLEQLSYYRHLSLSGGRERPICAYRILDLRGEHFHVLSRILDAGLDFTGRTNFIAHHLLITQDELQDLPIPPLILRDWPGWMSTWTQDPQLLADENWNNLRSLAGQTCLPAQTWQRVTGETINAGALLEIKPGTFIDASGTDEKDILNLLCESLELLEIRDARRNYRTSAWEYTFTTSLQEQDAPADFRWRFVQPDSPAFARFGAAGSPTLSSLRPSRTTPEEAALANLGWQPPSQVKVHISRDSITEGETVRLDAKSDGSPAPAFRWFEVEQGRRIELPGQAGSTLEDRPRGRAKRYLAQAFNRAGTRDSNVVELSIGSPLRVTSTRYAVGEPGARMAGDLQLKTEQEIEADRKKWQTRADQEKQQPKKWKFWLVLLCGGVAIALMATMVANSNHATHPDSTTNQPPSVADGKDSEAVKDSNTQVTPPPNGSLALQLSNGASQVLTSAPQSTLDTENAPLSNAAPREPLAADDFAPLPESWKPISIGTDAATGSAVRRGDAFQLSGAGRNIDGDFDHFFFVHQRLGSSTVFQTRLVQTPGQGSPYMRCGIMMRGSAQPDAPFVFIGASSEALWWVARGEQRQSAVCQRIESIAGLPLFLRLTRTGDSFVGAHATNDTDWIAVQTNQVNMPSAGGLVGFAVCSGKVDQQASAVFDMVSIKRLKRGH